MNFLLTVALGSVVSLAAWAETPPIFQYIQDDDYAAIERLIVEGTDVNVKNPEFFNSTPLIEVAYKLEKFNPAYQKIAFMLVEHGANVNQRNLIGSSAVSIAVRLHPDSKFLSLLIERGANLNEKYQSHEETLLHIIFENPHLNAFENFELLLNHGLDVDAQTKNGMTPLMLAMEYDGRLYEDCGFMRRHIAALLERRPNLELEDKYFGLSALKHGIDTINEVGCVDLGSVELLLKAGAAVDEEAIEMAEAPELKRLLRQFKLSP